jgi:hypothetical protein
VGNLGCKYTVMHLVLLPGCFVILTRAFIIVVVLVLVLVLVVYHGCCWLLVVNELVLATNS